MFVSSKKLIRDQRAALSKDFATNLAPRRRGFRARAQRDRRDCQEATLRRSMRPVRAATRYPRESSRPRNENSPSATPLATADPFPEKCRFAWRQVLLLT